MKTNKKSKCYFSEVVDLTSRIGLKSIGSKIGLRSQQQLMQSNCTVEIQDETSLSIITKGGTVFNLPLDQKIQNIFPIADGLIIEFFTKQEPKFSEILKINKNLRNYSLESAQTANDCYSYAILNKHPLNPLKPLCIHKKSERLNWMNSPEKLAFASDFYPLIISYNTQLHRHSLHWLKVDLDEENKENSRLSFQNNTYLLSLFSENSSVQNTIFIETFFEENTKEQILKSCKILKNFNSNPAEIHVYALISDVTSFVKIYTINILNLDFELQNSVRITNIFNDVLDMHDFNIFERENCVDSYNYLNKAKNNEKIQKYQTLFELNNYLSAFLLLLHKDGSFFISKAGVKIMVFSINFSIYPIDINEIIKITSFKSLYANFSMLNNENMTLKVCPSIRNPLISMILNSISMILDPQIFDKLLSDIIKNCIYLPELTFSLKNNDKIWKTKENEFDNFVLFFIFLLKSGQKNSQEDLLFNTKIFPEEVPIKKVKISEKTNTFESSFDRLLQTEYHFNKMNTNFLLPMTLNEKNKENGLFFNEIPNVANQVFPFLQEENKVFDNPAKDFEFETSAEQFHYERVRIFRVLHLLYEELKLNNTYKNLMDSFAFFMYFFAQNLSHKLSTVYCDYYVRDSPNLLNRAFYSGFIKNLNSIIAKKYFGGNKDNNLQNNVLGENEFIEINPPDFKQWQLKILSNENFHEPFPIFFKTTSFICKFFQLLLSKNKIRQISSLLSSNKQYSQFFNDLQININQLKNTFFHSKVFKLKSDKNKKKKELLRELSKASKSPSQKVFLYMIKSEIQYSLISTLPLSFRLILSEVLRVLRLKFTTIFPEKLPKIGYFLLDRPDLFKNFPSKPPQSLFSDALNSIIRGNKSVLEDLSSFSGDFNEENNQQSDGVLKKTDMIFLEVQRLLDISKNIKIKSKYVENIPEDRLEVDSQQILQKFCVRRLSCFVGRGAFWFSTHQTFITEVLKIPKLNFSAILPNDLKVTFELKDESNAANNTNTNSMDSKSNISLWPDFHNGVATAIKLSKTAFSMNQNHLRTWIFYQKPETPRYDHGGFLMGLGMLGYLSSFLPTDIYQYLKQSHDATTVGILLGLAASRIGKVEENISKTLCLHIPYLLPPNYDVEIALIVQTAALIGIGLLNKGTCNRLMTEMTLAQIGRKPVNDKCLDRDGYSLAAGYSLGLINIGRGSNNSNIKDLDLDERLIRFVEGGKPMDPPSSMLSTNFSSENRCSSIREGKTVNTHITAPAALLALSLMHLKSENDKIAKRITIPNSFSSIENANPNHILLKILTKNLILWDQIKNTEQFIYSQIPDLIRFIYEKSLKEVFERYYFIYNVEEIDFNTVTLIYVNIIGGCIMAIGLKYAGTGDPTAVETILREIDKIRKIRIAKSDLANDPANKSALDQYNHFSLLCVCLLAVSLIMSGTCDVQCLKTARIIRKRLQDASCFHYGFNMAINMAIGFLFLGNGNHSFSRDDLSLAGLLISIYPHFPNSTNDNKYHLQALRHFYILAIEQRVFHAIDVDKNVTVNVHVEMEFEMNNFLVKEKHLTPILLQDSKKLVGVKIIDCDYYDSEIKFYDGFKGKTIYVKKKIDAKEINFKKKNSEIINEENIIFKMVDYLENDENKYNLNDVDFLMGVQKNTKNEFIESKKQNELFLQQNKINNKQNLYQNLTNICLELIKEERLNFLELYLILFKKIITLKECDTEFISNLLIIEKFYENTGLANEITDNSVSNYFNSTKIRLIKRQIENFFDFKNLLRNQIFINYFNNPELDISQWFNIQSKDKVEEIMKFCVLNQIPNTTELTLMKKFFLKLNMLNKNVDQNEENNGVIELAKMILFFQFPLATSNVLLTISKEIYNKH